MIAPDNSQEHDLSSLPLWAQDLILRLTAQVHQLTTQVQQLTARVHELEGQLAKNSSNSGKPPSSDGLSKPKKTGSLRGKSGRKPGGQLGRKGAYLKPVENPDKVEVHSPKICANCEASLESVDASGVERRQVFDLPPISVQVEPG